MIYNPFYWWIPNIPVYDEKPPTIYSILNSIVNYDQPDKTMIKDLAKAGRSEIFDFNYPLTVNINKEDFEVMILNHFLMRRIGFETVQAFKIQLNVKLNEIMPKYNILFNAISNWDLFKDGQVIEKIGLNNTNKNTESIANTNSTITSEDHANAKNKHSDLPQSELQNIDDNRYVNMYDNNLQDSNTTSTNNGTANNNTDENTQNNYNETIKYTQSDLISLYARFQSEIQNVYTLLFKDLDVLFYGLI